GGVGQPQQPACGAAPGGAEVGADGGAGQGVGGAAGGGEHHGDAGLGGDRGGLDLRHHAAGADPRPAGAAQLDAVEVVRPGDLGDAAGTRPGRVAVVQRVHVRQQHQQVGADEVGDESGEPVVVAEADLLGDH